MTRPIPSAAVEMIKSFEGVRLAAYADVAGVVTVGWGHVEPGLKVGEVISKAKADLYLMKDIEIAQRRLAKVLKPDVLARLTDSQYAALLSFVFNLGCDASWGIWRLINAGDFARVPSRLRLYNKARINGKLVQVNGLTRRRVAEGELWDQDQGVDVVLTASHAETPPTPIVKPLVQSKTLWAGGTVAASGVVTGATQVQALIAPQADNSELLAKLAGVMAFLIVAGGIAIMAFKWLEQRSRQA